MQIYKFYFIFIIILLILNLQGTQQSIEFGENRPVSYNGGSNGFQKGWYTEQNYTITFSNTFHNIPEVILSYKHLDISGGYAYMGLYIRVVEVTLTTFTYELKIDSDKVLITIIINYLAYDNYPQKLFSKQIFSFNPSVDGALQTFTIQSQGQCTSLQSQIILNEYQDQTSSQNQIKLSLESEPAHLGGDDFQVQVKMARFDGDASQITHVSFVIFSACSEFLQNADYDHSTYFDETYARQFIPVQVSQSNMIYTATTRYIDGWLNGFHHKSASIKITAWSFDYTVIDATTGEFDINFMAHNWSQMFKIYISTMVFITPDCVSPCKACQGSLSYCIECNDGQYLVGSTCLDCADKCATCETSSTNCQTCSATANYNAAPSCTCVDKYYFDGSECQDCPSQCAICSDYTTCSSCADGYYLSGNDCLACHYSCSTCSAYHTCSACSDTNRQNSITCPCIDKFFDDGDAICENCPTECTTCTDLSTCQSCEDGYYLSGNDCLQCHYSCSTCSDYHVCTTCSDTNRDDGTSLCDCKIKFFDDGDAICENCQTECAECTDNSTCQSCEDGYYLSGADCLQCHYSCDTCTDYHVCVLCSHYQRPSTPDCDCASGHFDDGTYQCQQCVYPCSTCSDLNTCESCVNTQYRNPDCSCLSGYSDDGTECIRCDDSCVTCDIDECFTCKENRVPDVVGSQQCICPTDDIAGLDHFTSLNTYMCTTCESTQIILEITELNVLSAYFYFRIELPNFLDNYTIYSKELCVYLFGTSQLSIFGNNPTCKLVDNAHSIIYIQFQYTSTYQQGDSIEFLSNKIRRQGCTLVMNDIQIAKINNVDISTLSNPSIKIDGDTKYSICRNINFSIEQIKNDGKHDLNNIKWTLDSVDFPSSFGTADNDPIYMNDINVNYLSNFDNMQTLTFPSYFLEQMTTYSIVITFYNYLSMQGAYTLTFQVLGDTQSVIQFQETYDPLVIKPTNYQYIYYKIFNIVCIQDSEGNVSSIIVYDQTDYQINEMTDSSYSTIGSTILSETSNDFEENLMFEIQPYDYAAGNIYYLQFKTIVDNYGIDVGQEIHLSFEVEVLDYIVQIANGNRQHSYTSELILEATYSDLNVEESLQQSGFTLYWECESMVQDDGICRNIQNNPIIMTQSVDNQQFNAKYFEPYSTFRYTFYAEKSFTNYTDSVLIIIIEEDVPSLSLELPDTLKGGTTNLNDDLYLQVDYEADSSITLQYNAILMYNSDKVAIKSFEYKKFSFRIWDLFNDFESGNYQITIKITCYNPYFSLPAISTFTLDLNEPPSNCFLQVTPTDGISISTLFSLSILNCEDDNLPLSYKFSYYINNEEYLVEKYQGTQSTSLKKQTLQTYGTNNLISTILPRAYTSNSDDGEEETIIIMVSVKDQYNGITNITQTIQVSPDITISQQLNNIQSQLNLVISQSDWEKTRILGILTQELNIGKNDFYSENPETFIEILEIIQTILNTLKKYLQVKSQIDQAINSLYLVETMLNDFTILSEFPMNEQLDYTEYIVTEQQKVIQNLIDSQQISQSDSQVSLAVEQSKEILGKSYKSLDSYISIFSKNEQKNNTMAVEFQEKIKKIGQIYNNISLPNSDPVIYSGNGVLVTSQKKTADKLNQLFATLSTETLYTSEEIVFDSEGTLDTIYDYQFINFEKNILQEEFIYPDQQNKLKQIQIKNNDTQETIELNSPVTFDFTDEIKLNETENATNLWCLSYEINKKSEQEWTNQKCQTNYFASSNNIQCECETQQEVTVVNDYNLVFQDTVSYIADNAKNAFTANAVEDLLDFDFHKSTIFYFIIVIAVFETYLIISGIKKDKQEKPQYELAKKYLKEKKVTKTNNKKQDMKIYNMDGKKIQNANEQTANTIDNENIQMQNDGQESDIRYSNADIISPKNSSRNTSLKKLTLLKDDNSNQKVEQLDVNEQIEVQQKQINKGKPKKRSRKSVYKINRIPLNEQEDNSKGQENNINQAIQKRESSQNFLQGINSNENLNLQGIQNENTKTNDDNRNNDDEKKSDAEQLQKPQFQKKISIFNTFLVFHQFFQIYFVFVKKESRPVRYLVYFLKIYLALSISSFFIGTDQYTQIQQTVIMVILLLFTQVPLVIVKILLATNQIIIKFIGFIIFSFISLLSAWLIVTNAAGIGAEDSNEWFISYLTGFFFDFGVTQGVTSTILNYIILKSGRESRIIQILLNTDVIDYYYLTYHDY